MCGSCAADSDFEFLFFEKGMSISRRSILGGENAEKAVSEPSTDPAFSICGQNQVSNETDPFDLVWRDMCSPVKKGLVVTIATNPFKYGATERN